MKVAAIQMPTVKDKIQNIRTVGTYIEKIKAENPDFVNLSHIICFRHGTCDQINMILSGIIRQRRSARW